MRIFWDKYWDIRAQKYVHVAHTQAIVSLETDNEFLSKEQTALMEDNLSVVLHNNKKSVRWEETTTQPEKPDPSASDQGSSMK